MKEFYEIKEIKTDVNRYIKDGWILVDSYKKSKLWRWEYIIYTVGYPYNRKLEDLTEIINIYEKYGFKEHLFKKVAKDNGEDFSKITDYSYIDSETNKTTTFMNWFEKKLGTNRKYAVKVKEKKSRDDESKIFEENLPFE